MSVKAGKAMIRRFLKGRGGFTLVESVMAVVILGVALGACVLSFSMAMRAVNTAGNQMTAMHYARNELEALRTNSFSATALNPGTYQISNAIYSGSYTVSNINTATKNVTVSIPYLNRIHRGTSTNTLTTSLVTTLHP